MEQISAIDSRLSAIPPKIGFPLRKLLELGHVDEASVGTVLDAGELAGDRSRLLGFAVAFLYLQSKGIPVRDVVRMAQNQRRRINLQWSANRWQSEHDRLSRAETLQRLSGESVQYDVSAYARRLPARYPGYLIRTSRRLGMEGLRQRHCVASYHHQLQAGYCAIASVFVNRRRWTVQLMSDRNSESAIRIVQIKTRLNQLPSTKEREEIFRSLGIEPERNLQAPIEVRQRPHAYKDNLRRVLPILRENLVESVTVSFDGSGDSGSIQDVQYEGRFDGAAVRVQIDKAVAEFDNGQWVTQHRLSEVNVTEAIEAVTDEYLEHAGVNWYDGDGGFGELLIDVNDGTVSLEINVRSTDSTQEFSQTLDIETGEEVE